MRSSSAPDPEGFGDHPDQYAVDRVRRLRVPGWCASRSRCASMPALPIRPAMRLRIDHALTPGRPCHIG
jgi:hypothetical protein